MPPSRMPRSSTPWLIIGILWSLVLLALLLPGVRVLKDYQLPGHFDQFHVGYCDFHNGVYFPAQAWLAGDNPYSAQYAAEYPVMRQVPLYSPFVFLAHAPLAWLPLRLAEIVYFIVMGALIVALSVILVRSLKEQPTSLAQCSALQPWLGRQSQGFMIAVIALLIACSRPAHVTLHSGYFSLELAVAVVVMFASLEQRPWLAAFALAYSSIKPTYAIPLGLMLLAFGRFSVVLRGTVLAMAMAGLTLGWTISQTKQEMDVSWSMAARGVVGDMLSTQEVHREQNWEKPAVSWTRVDWLGIAARWVKSEPNDWQHLQGMALMILLPMGVVWWGRRREQESPLTGVLVGIALLATLLTLYKHAYDLLLVLPPLVGVVFGTDRWCRFSSPVRWLLVGLLGFPLANYLSTKLVLDRIHLPWPWLDLLCSLNTISLTLALLVMLGSVFLSNWGPSTTGDNRPNLL